MLCIYKNPLFTKNIIISYLCFTIRMIYLILLAGDVELNQGPASIDSGSNGLSDSSMFDFLVWLNFPFFLVWLNFPFLDGDVPRSTSYGVYISQLIRFARASSYVADFNTRNKLLTQKFLKQCYRYHKLCKTFSKF